MIFMRSVLAVIAYCSLVYGQCDFHGDQSTKSIQEKIKSWKIYRQNLTVSSNELTYAVGICSSLNNNGAIIQQGKNFSYTLGKLDRVNLVGGDSWIMITYENGDPYVNMCNNATRSASIMFVCGSNMKNLSLIQEHTDADPDQHCNFMFQLQVPEMCPVVVTNNKLSGGAIFLIILFSLASLYFVGGAIFMHIKRGARGIDHIPNIVMWRRLGHLAADGCDFCCRCERTTTRAGYFLDESEANMVGDDDILSP